MGSLRMGVKEPVRLLAFFLLAVVRVRGMKKILLITQIIINYENK